MICDVFIPHQEMNTSKLSCSVIKKHSDCYINYVETEWDAESWPKYRNFEAAAQYTIKYIPQHTVPNLYSKMY